MFPPLRLTVVKPGTVLLAADGLEWVKVQLCDGGGIGIYPGHGPLLAATDDGDVRYADASGEHALRVPAGILRIDEGAVTIYTAAAAEGR
jgi:F0F1-type ATP synthase epsilon subunit